MVGMKVGFLRGHERGRGVSVKMSPCKLQVSSISLLSQT